MHATKTFTTKNNAKGGALQLVLPVPVKGAPCFTGAGKNQSPMYSISNYHSIFTGTGKTRCY